MTRIYALLAAVVLSVAPVFAQQYNITPFLTCVDYESSTNTLTAYFGYESTEGAIIQVLVGNDNRFVPNPQGRGQPVLFMPGLFERAFRVTLPGDQISQWIFLGIAVTVSNASQPCHPAPAPSSLPPAVVSVPYSQQLAATGGLAPLQWSAISALPPGLTLSLNGTLAGIPLSVGTFPLTVRATDGATPATRTYQLVVGAGVAINDAVSTRAPGFTPQFRVVTNAAATIAATASCNVSEFVVTGGGSCTVPNSNTVQGRMASSQPASNGWTVTCSGGTATAVVVCQVR